MIAHPGKGFSADFNHLVLRLQRLGHDIDAIEAIVKVQTITPERYERRLRNEIARVLGKVEARDRKAESALQALRERLYGKPQEAASQAVGDHADQWPTNPLLLTDGHPRENAKVDYLVDGKLPRVGSGILSPTQWGAGKSFVAEDLGGAIIIGGTFAGSQVLAPGGVLWLAYRGCEVGAGLAALKMHKLGTDELLPFAYSVEPPGLQSDYDGLTKLVGDAALWLREQHSVELRLIVFDTTAAAAGFKDENSAAEVQAVMSLASGLARAADCFVLLVDHLGKDKQQGTRGSSAKEAAADVILAIDCDRTQEGETCNHRLSVRKLRGGPSGSTMPFKLRVVETPDRDGVLTTSCIVAWGETDAAAPKPAKLSLRVERLLIALDRARSGKDRSTRNRTDEGAGCRAGNPARRVLFGLSRREPERQAARVQCSHP